MLVVVLEDGVDVTRCPVDLADSAAAIEWFEAEWGNAVAGVRYAAIHGHDRHAWQLTRLLQPFLGAAGNLTDLLATHKAGPAAARRLGDPHAIGYMLNGLGVVRARLGKYEEAIGYFEERVAIARRLGDRAGERAALDKLILPYQKVGRHRTALRAARQAMLVGQAATPDKRAITLNNLAEAYLLAGHPERAVTEAARPRRGTGRGGVVAFPWRYPVGGWVTSVARRRRCRPRWSGTSAWVTRRQHRSRRN